MALHFYIILNFKVHSVTISLDLPFQDYSAFSHVISSLYGPNSGRLGKVNLFNSILLSALSCVISTDAFTFGTISYCIHAFQSPGSWIPFSLNSNQKSHQGPWWMVRFFCDPFLSHKGDLQHLLCSPMILNPRDVSWLAKAKRKKVKKKCKKKKTKQNKKGQVKLIDNIQYLTHTFKCQ